MPSVVECAWSPVQIWPVLSDILTPIHVNINDSSPRRFSYITNYTCLQFSFGDYYFNL
jgi:hypothetical protein